MNKNEDQEEKKILEDNTNNEKVELSDKSFEEEAIKAEGQEEALDFDATIDLELVRKKSKKGGIPKVGYSKTSKEKKKKHHYVKRILISNPTKPKVGIDEKIVKFIIYIALRLVIKPSKFRDSDKSYEIVDRTYRRIISADFIYIPSSIAFSLIMALLPVLSIILFLYQFPAVHNFLNNGSKGNEDSLVKVLGNFVPGMESVLKQIAGAISDASNGIKVPGIIAILTSLLISTWIAAGGFSRLVFTQSYIFDHKFQGGFWMNKIKGMFMVMGFSLYLMVALVINIFVDKWISGSSLPDVWKSFFSNAFLLIGLFMLILSLFIGLYKFSPRFKIKLKHVLPGAMTSALPTTLFLGFFGTISSIWSYGSYGVIGVLMYFGMASLLISYFIFVGISVNNSYFKTFVGLRVKNKWTLSKK